MNETEAKILIKRYIDNQATDEELQVFHDWLLQHPDEEINRLMNEYDAIFRENFTAGPINTQWLLRLLTRLQKEKETPPQKPVDRSIKSSRLIQMCVHPQNLEISSGFPFSPLRQIHHVSMNCNMLISRIAFAQFLSTI